MVSVYGTTVFLKFYCEVVRSSDNYLYYCMLLQMFKLTQQILKYVNTIKFTWVIFLQSGHSPHQLWRHSKSLKCGFLSLFLMWPIL